MSAVSGTRTLIGPVRRTVTIQKLNLTADHTVRHRRRVFVNCNWINQLSNTTIRWLDIYVVYYIGINCMFRLLWPSSG